MEEEARSDWSEAFQRMADQGDDEMLDDWPPTAWEAVEWEWDEQDQGLVAEDG